MHTLRVLGPDFHQSITRQVELRPGSSIELKLRASVLHMRGTTLQPQPFVAENGDVLLWNGEIFDGLDVRPSSVAASAV